MVKLAGIQHAAMSALPDDSIFQPALKQPPQFHGERIDIDILHPVTAHQQSELILLIKIRKPVRHIEKCEREPVPSAQAKTGTQKIIGHILNAFLILTGSRRFMRDTGSFLPPVRVAAFVAVVVFKTGKRSVIGTLTGFILFVEVDRVSAPVGEKTVFILVIGC